MTYVVTEACIKCRRPTASRSAPWTASTRAITCWSSIRTNASIAACEPECPADAIKPDTEPGLEKRLEANTEYAKSWPNITQKKESLPDAKEFEGVDGKFEKYSSKPGTETDLNTGQIWRKSVST